MPTTALFNLRSRVFIFRPDGKFLVMVRNFKKQTGESHKCVLLPGGGVDEGESVKEALIREVLEETGIEMLNVEHIWTMTEERPTATNEKAYFKGATRIKNVFEFFKASTKLSVKPKIIEPEKFDDVAWIHRDELISYSKKHNADEIGDGIEEAMAFLDSKPVSMESRSRLLTWV